MDKKAGNKVTLAEFLEAAREAGVEGLWLGSIGGCVIRLESADPDPAGDEDEEDHSSHGTAVAEGETIEEREGDSQNASS